MVRRQARGERRIGDILDAALVLFAEAGYEKTSTNAIAARAGMSPGSLYQYFPNKDAIAEALSRRLLGQLREAHEAAFATADAAALPLPELISRVVDPLVAFHVANPGAKELIGAFRATNPGAEESSGAESRPLHEGVTERVAALLRMRAPDLGEEEVRRTAMVAVQIVAALLGPIVAAAEPERTTLAEELKRALTGYLAPRAGH